MEVRVLPWHEHSNGSDKYILLRDVSIEGEAFEPTRIEEISSEPSAFRVQKILRDDVLFILRDDKLYNAQGAEVK